MCLVEREEANGRPAVEKAAAPAPAVSIFTAADVRREYSGMQDVPPPPVFAVAATCELYRKARRDEYAAQPLRSA